MNCLRGSLWSDLELFRGLFVACFMACLWGYFRLKLWTVLGIVLG